jgi:N-acetylglucosaminyldiphosphoundecaprenol N-acetyl-beta-D-mannosaminyltransferase
MQQREAFGVRLTPATRSAYIDFVDDRIVRRQRTTVFYQNLHSLYFYLRDGDFRRRLDASVTMVDGMPLVWLLKLAGQPVDRRQRVTWVDFLWPLLDRAERRGWRVFVLGNAPEVHARALGILRTRLPDLAIAGRHGYFDAAAGAETAAVLAEINAFRPDLCLVGMGTPRQELWVDANRPLIEAPVVMTCGACLDYVAGAIRTPPRVMGRCGLEWLFRLVDSPRRCAWRYLLEPWLVLALLVRRNLTPFAGADDRHV